tara:strand:- start:1245 stop:1628 length:384 start_codon:yes stop_codon:yes gene_type:complete
MIKNNRVPYRRSVSKSESESESESDAPSRKSSLADDPAPPRKAKGDRQRAVRSDKGKDHKWSDGRERTDTYKENEGVNWSRIRCRSGTCWKTETRKTDKKGSGAFKKNVEGGHYKGQLRRKGRRANN